MEAATKFEFKSSVLSVIVFVILGWLSILDQIYGVPEINVTSNTKYKTNLYQYSIKC